MSSPSVDIEPRQPRLLSVVLPAFNEQEVLPKTYARFTAQAEVLLADGFTYELVFVNDGSTDRTPQTLNDLARQDAHVRVVHLTRNFGHQAAVTAGLVQARGDVVAVMDCDLQDPPEVLPRFLKMWREGFAVVYAIRAKRKEWVGKRLAYWTFYRLLSAISELEIPLDSGDFCVMDRRAVDLLNMLPESQRFVRGLRTWVGLCQTGIVYERDARQAGRPAYTFRALRRLAIDGLVSFSNVPLRMVTRLGVLSGLLAVALGIFVVTARLIFSSHRFPWGWSSLACLILLASSVQLLSLGVIGEYLARIFIEVKRRPTFLIAEVVEQTHDSSPHVETAQAAAPVETLVSGANELTTDARESQAVREELPAENPVQSESAAPADPAEPKPTFYFIKDRRQVLVKTVMPHPATTDHASPSHSG